MVGDVVAVVVAPGQGMAIVVVVAAAVIASAGQDLVGQCGGVRFVELKSKEIQNMKLLINKTLSERS